ncbi:MAG: amino acid ABC transporter permease [Deltaproteobacteria bacterium]|nr:amino acid ABC transporter permease [Deltaproteobacteria bacterium]
MHWEVVWNNMDYFLLGRYPAGPLGGLALSILLALGGIFLAFWIGIIFGLLRLSKRWYLRIPSIIYIEIIRGTPLLLLIFWFYFLAPVIFHRPMPEARTTLMAFAVFTGAYVAEIVRAGILSIPKGQMEAARSSGLNHRQAMTYIVLPQALRNMIPSFVNQFVSLTKDTSLAYIIGVQELTRAATQVNNRSLTAPAEIFFAIAVIYFIICFSLTQTSRWLEKRLSYRTAGKIHQKAIELLDDSLE